MFHVEQPLVVAMTGPCSHLLLLLLLLLLPGRARSQPLDGRLAAGFLRQGRGLRPASQGSRFALSLDVPTTILSVLIDLAKHHDLRAKAAANAELMARIGRRK
uniref:Corticotropin-releasing factor domain-containing protein n=1 Tax=Denticeps clupeoides TaxID=299321 RepID=A0AAY4CSK1_9TELE